MDRIEIGDKVKLVELGPVTYTVRSVVMRDDKYDLALFIEGSRELIEVTVEPNQIEILQQGN